MEALADMAFACDDWRFVCAMKHLQVQSSERLTGLRSTRADSTLLNDSHPLAQELPNRIAVA